MSKATQRTKKKALEILEKNRADYQELERQIEVYKRQEQEAASAMESAGDKMDLAEYNAARAKQFEAESALEMYGARKDKMEVQPMLSEEEYLKMCDTVTADAAASCVTMRAKLYELAQQIDALYEGYREEIREYDEVLHLLQYDLYKAYDMNRAPSGNIVGRGKEIDGREAYQYLSWIGDPAKECLKAMEAAGVTKQEESA